MRKCIKFIPVLMAATLLFGCGKKDEITSADLAKVLTENSLFSESLTEIGSAAARKRYSLNSKDYTEILAYVGTASTTDEFVIIKTTSPETIKTGLDEYIEYKRGEYEDYRPNEVGKLDGVIIEEYNDAVVMIITARTDEARDAYEDYLKD